MPRLAHLLRNLCTALSLQARPTTSSSSSSTTALYPELRCSLTLITCLQRLNIKSAKTPTRKSARRVTRVFLGSRCWKALPFAWCTQLNMQILTVESEKHGTNRLLSMYICVLLFLLITPRCLPEGAKNIQYTNELILCSPIPQACRTQTPTPYSHKSLLVSLLTFSLTSLSPSTLSSCSNSASFYSSFSLLPHFSLILSLNIGLS